MSRWGFILCVAVVGCGVYWYSNKKSCSTCCPTNDRWDAAYYKDHSAGQLQGGLDALNNLKFQGNESVLDIGSGDGKLTAAIAERVPQGTVVGIDASNNMITEAQKGFAAIKNLSFKLARAEEFVSPDQQYNLVTSFSAFHWVADAGKSFKNIFAMLKPAGQLLIRTPAKDDQHPIAKVFASDKWKSLAATYNATFHALSAEEYEKLLKDAGFQNVAVTIVPTTQVFNTEQEYVDHVMAWVPHATGLSGEQALEFAKDLAKGAREAMKTPSTDGRIESTSLVTMISASKEPAQAAPVTA
jgi:trans-aconitate 2-methyltransferase